VVEDPQVQAKTLALARSSKLQASVFRELLHHPADGGVN
jgi:hypothetical protein